MRYIDRRPDEQVIVGECVRVSVVSICGDSVRLGFDGPESVDIRPERFEGADVVSPRRDVLAWHPQADRIVDLIVEQFPSAREDVRSIRSGVSYHGLDLTLYSAIKHFALGIRAGESLATSSPQAESIA